MNKGKNSVGLYIHIPFCIKKCKYCDFVSYCGCEKIFDKYIDALISEARLYEKLSADTVFIGGGTPTILSPDRLNRLIHGIRKSIKITDDAEFTVEANPKTIDNEKCRSLKECGVNRLSIGVQSFCDDELRLLGRVHDSKCAEETILTAQRFFDNISVDLMLSIPEQTLESAVMSAEKAVSLGVSHMSCYTLIIEEGTQFNKMLSNGELKLPSDDEDREIFNAVCEKIKKSGFERYEISNFAKDNNSCRHNMKYWRAEEYIGLGAAAHSYLDGMRFSNTSDIEKYISEPHKFSEKHILTEKDKISEYNMLTLRTSRGIDRQEFLKRFGKSIDELFPNVAERFIKLGLMRDTGECYVLTAAGTDVSNSIMCEFIL